MSQPARFDFTPALSGERIALRPLCAEDFEALYTAASDPLIWAQHPVPLRYQRQVFQASFWNSAIQGDGALVITDKSSGEVIGSSRFYDWKPSSGEIVIGFTFLVRSRWGEGTNRELKQLMLRHAFKQARRVWFHIGRDNLRSRRAIEKIGAIFSHEVAAGPNGVTVHYRLDAPRGRESPFRHRGEVG